MAIHSSVLAWRIPGTGKPDGLPSMGSHRVGHDWSDLAAAAAVQLFATPWTARLLCLPLSLRVWSNSCPLMLSNHLILCHPLLFLPSVFSSIRVFSSESALRIRWLKYWSFSISPSNEYSGLISFRIDWLDLLVVQGTLKSLLQHHNLKTPILRHSAFFMIQLSHSYVTTEKTRALTIQTFVGKVISLLFNMLYMSVVAFLPRSLLIIYIKLQHSLFI